MLTKGFISNSACQVKRCRGKKKTFIVEKWVRVLLSFHCFWFPRCHLISHVRHRSCTHTAKDRLNWASGTHGQWTTQKVNYVCWLSRTIASQHHTAFDLGVQNNLTFFVRYFYNYIGQTFREVSERLSSYTTLKLTYRLIKINCNQSDSKSESYNFGRFQNLIVLSLIWEPTHTESLENFVSTMMKNKTVQFTSDSNNSCFKWC